MDNNFKLVLILILSFVSFPVFSNPANLSTGFLARELVQFKKDVQLTSLLAGMGNVNYQAQTTGGALVNASRNVNITKKAMGGVLRRLLLTPWGAGLTVLLTAADYLLDSSTGDISTIQGSGSLTSLGLCGLNGTENGTLGDCVDYANAHRTSYELSNNFIFSAENESSCSVSADRFHFCTDIGFRSDLHPNFTPRSYYAGRDATAYMTPPISDSALSDVMTPQLSDNQLKNILIDQNTNLPNSNVDSTPQPANTSTPDTDPIQHEADNITNNYNTDLSNNPTLNPTTYNNDYNNTTYNSPQAVDAKTDCDKYPKSIGCSEYGDELKAVKYENLEIPFEYQPVFLASNAQCPSKPVAVTSFGNVSPDNQPLCDFATAINPVVIAICSLFGLVLLTGGIRNG